MIKKILENLGRKKPAKSAKSAKKAAPAKKPAAKTAKAPAKAAKKPAPKTAKAPAKKASAKKAPAKVASKKAPAKVASKKAPAKVVAKKAPAKVVAKKAPAKVVKPAPLSPKEKAKLQKQKLAEKLAAQKLKEKLAKDKAKEKVKAKELAKKQKEEEKRLKQKQKEEAKAEKLRLKDEEKRKKIEAKRGKKEGLSPEEMDAEARPRNADEEDEDDFGADSAKPKKMVFDEIPDEEFIPVRKSKKSVLDEEIRESLVEEILALSEDFALEDVFSSIRNMELFKVDSDECVVRGCDNPATTGGYCRYHYIKLWKDVKKKELILSEGKLAKIIEELVRKYPMKFIENIIQDLADDKAFSHVLKDLDIETDENEMDGFDDDELLDDDQDIAFETKVTKPSFDD